MSQPVHVRPRAINYILFVFSVILIGSVLYWGLDRYVINQEVSFEAIDHGTREVAFTFAPEFTLFNLDTKPIQLESFKDKIVIVNFWASWCGPCEEEFPSLMKYIEEFKGDVVLLAVSQDDTPEVVKKFLKKFKATPGPNFHVLLDLDRTVGRKYKVSALPESFIFSKNLKLERKIVGYRDWMSPSSIAEIKKLIGSRL